MPMQSQSMIRRFAASRVVGKCAFLLAVGCSTVLAAEPAPLKAPFDAPTAAQAQKDWAAQIKTDVIAKNSLGMKLALIPPGEFLMGNEELELDTLRALAKFYPKLESLADATKQHRVRITKPFYLGVHTVTKAQFANFVEVAKYKTDAERNHHGGWGVTTQGEWAQKRAYNWRNPGFKQTDDDTVVNVSWNDAVAFCAWLSKKETKKYRLPTEAEWEYACRSGSATRYYFGKDSEGLAKYANVADAAAKAKFPAWNTIAANDGNIFTAPVGSFLPNAFGLYDMHGNVWQWCADWYGRDYYHAAPQDDPQGPTEGELRVYRGGSWHANPLECRAAYRGRNLPDYASDCRGFRVAYAPAAE